MPYATFADVAAYLPQKLIDSSSKPTEAQVTNTGLPDSEAEFNGRVRAVELKLGITFPIAGAAFLAWAQFMVSLMAAAWTLETRAAAVGGDAALQTAKYYRERANQQFEMLLDGEIAFEDTEEEPVAGFIRGGPDGDANPPRAFISVVRPHPRHF